MQLDETRLELERVRASHTHSSAHDKDAWEQEKVALTERIRELEARCASVTQVLVFVRLLPWSLSVKTPRASVVRAQWVALCLGARVQGELCCGAIRWRQCQLLGALRHAVLASLLPDV
jgi:hypothetical protein